MLFLALSVASAADAGEVTLGSDGLRFFEPFTWRGNHAASLGPGEGTGTTVWWDPDSWDVRGDTSFLAVASIGNGFHTDIHKAASANVRDGRTANEVYVVGGDGSPGVGIMHTDFQGIVSARLRNPMLISSTRPGVVSFYASRFQTGGHWWEVAITPTEIVAGAEYTSVPNVNDPFEDPLTFSTVGTPGPGHRPAVDSINFIATGYPDRPCDPGIGWRVRFGVSATVGAVNTDFVRKFDRISDLMLTDPSEIDRLFHWWLDFHPNRIDFFGDLDDDGVRELIDTYPVSVPWPEVYVHLLAVAYEADHHPQEPCFLGQVREFAWRDVAVAPVKHSATVATPKEEGTRNVPRESGWMGYDLRDIQRHGAPVRGVPQPNDGPYDRFSSQAYCGAERFFCTNPTPSANLEFTRPNRPERLVRAQFLYDIKSDPGTGVAILTVNGTRIGALPPASTIPGASGSEWVHRSIDIDPALLVSGRNQVRLDLQGDVQIDRMQMDLGYDTALARRRIVRR